MPFYTTTSLKIYWFNVLYLNPIKHFFVLFLIIGNWKTDNSNLEMHIVFRIVNINCVSSLPAQGLAWRGWLGMCTALIAEGSPPLVYTGSGPVSPQTLSTPYTMARTLYNAPLQIPPYTFVPCCICTKKTPIISIEWSISLHVLVYHNIKLLYYWVPIFIHLL